MHSASDFWNAVDDIVSDGRKRGVLFQTDEAQDPDGRTLLLEGRRLVNMASCGYVGVELEPSVRRGAAEAALRYGTQFPSSRTYVQAPLYRELDALLERLFGLPVLTAQTTTLAHLASLPVLIHEKDAAILDQRVHTCVQMAINHVRQQGTAVEILPHARMDLLAERVEALRGSKRRIWYLADGIYSMAGELAPLDQLRELLERYEQLRVYIDDAHGMSWTGERGMGWAPRLEHPRAYVATSLSKGFGAAGAALLLRDPEERRRVATVGPTMIFSGPLQPPQLGASVASARLHLEPGFARRQEALLERIRLCNALLVERGLPLVSPTDTPIRCVAVGSPKLAYAVVERLKEAGFYVNAAVFPAVPKARSGIRFTLTTHLTLEDVRSFADALAEAVPKVLEAEGISLQAARRGLGLGNIWSGAAAGSGMSVQHETTAERLDPGEWDGLLGENGSFTREGLLTLERTFTGPEPENEWGFHYWLVRGEGGRPVAATFFTDALWKDDMLASEEVSKRVEERRASEPYYLTSRGISMGSLLTEGMHLWLDRSADWRKAMLHLLEAVGEEQLRARATNLILRDLPADPELDGFLREQGFLRFAMPRSMVLDVEWKSEAEWLDKLSRRARKHQLENVLAHRERFEVEHLPGGARRLAPEERARLHELYLNVKAHSLAINTFAVPPRLLDAMLERPCWELLRLKVRPEYGGDGSTVAFGAIFRGERHCVPLMAGLDYRSPQAAHVYRVLLLETIRRCEALGARRIHLGMGAELEKQRFGAAAVESFVYVLSKDELNSEVLSQMRADLARSERDAAR